MRHPHVLQLIMDSLRYWVLDMHVDGFRFDLASSLARQFHEVDRLSAFFDLVQQDPVVSQVKLIAEPWDVGDGGYQVGNFPPLWTEWNGKYRDTVRDYWRGEPGVVGEFASRLSGSSDLYEHSGRKPIASINFVTAHDGFTIRDLVSYNEKHNEANGEGNNDGESHNRSWNCGVEGATDDPRPCRRCGPASSATSWSPCCSRQGVPMMLHGDELGRSQHGNNNVYCQDNELSWMDWDLAGWQKELLAFTQRVVALRNDHPVFRRRRFFAGEVTRWPAAPPPTSPGSPRTARPRHGTGTTPTTSRSWCSSTATASPSPAARRAGGRRLVPDRVQRRRPGDAVHDPRRGVRRGLDRRAGHPRRRRGQRVLLRRRHPAGARAGVPGRPTARWWCCAGPR